MKEYVGKKPVNPLCDRNYKEALPTVNRDLQDYSRFRNEMLYQFVNWLVDKTIGFCATL